MKHRNSKVTVYRDGKVVGYQHSSGKPMSRKPTEKELRVK